MRQPCCDKEGTNKGAWSKQEDQKLVDYIRLHGEGCWRSLPKAAGLLRCGKSCRLRWANYLRPDIKRGDFSPDEEELIIKLHALLGNRWSLIAGRLPGRTDNEVKNHWNCHMRKKLIKMGIDPNNHKLNQIPQYHYHPPRQARLLCSTSASMSKEAHVNGDNDRVSEAGSCLVEENDHAVSTASSHPDLNDTLDLNIAVSSSSPAVVVAGDQKPDNTVSSARDEVVQTLVLFD